MKKSVAFLFFFLFQVLAYGQEEGIVAEEDKGALGLDQWELINFLYLLAVLVVLLFFRYWKGRGYKE